MTDVRFPACFHLRTTREFQQVFSRRASAGDGLILVFGHPNTLGHARLGLSVSRKVGNAVVRNRWKRLLREAFRLSRESMPSGIDLVIVPRAGAVPTLAGVQASLARLAGRIAQRLNKPAPSTRGAT